MFCGAFGARGSGSQSANRDALNSVALVVFCQMVHWLTFAAIPLLLPLIRDDLQISFTQAGMLSAAGALSYTLCQLPAGFLADRFGPRRLFLVGLVGWSLLSVSFGLIESFSLALLNQFVAGALRALLFIPSLAFLASWFPPQRRATAMSLALVGAAAGSILLALAGPALAQGYGWRFTFIAFAALGLAAAVLFGVYAKDNPRAPSSRTVGVLEIVQLTRYPIMWVCSGLQFVRFAVVMGFNFWLPSFLVTERGMSIQAAGLVIAMGAALSAPSNALGAYVSDRLNNPPLVIGGALTILACAAMLLPFASTEPQVLAVVALFSIFLGSYFGPLFLVPVEVLGPRVVGTSAGFGNLFANIGGFISVYALGVIKDHAGTFAWGFIGIGSVCLIGVALAVVLGHLRTRMLAAARA